MQAYDARFHPPAPIAMVVVKSHQLGVMVDDVPMLLDTGADVSLLPREQLSRLLTPDARQYELESFDGTRSTAPVVSAELQLLGKSFRGQFLLIDGGHGVLGRNVLNHLSVVFDGPSGQWSEQGTS
jgi:predicted aspartyl protease